jgi:hypothetical protein
MPTIGVATIAVLLVALASLIGASNALEHNTDRPGMDYDNFDLASANPSLCEQACQADPECRAFTYVKPGVQGASARCWLKNGIPEANPSDCCDSGVKGSTGVACHPDLPSPSLVLTGTEDYTVGSNQFTRYKLAVSNRASYPADLFLSAPDLPPCGANTNSARAWVEIYADNGTNIYGFCSLSSPSDLGNLWFAVPRGHAPPHGVYIIINDRRCHLPYRSNTVLLTPTAAPPMPAGLESGVDRPGSDYRNFDLSSASPSLCQQACNDDPGCRAFTYVKPGFQGPSARCWLKNTVPAATPSECCVSGVKAISGGSSGSGSSDLTGVWNCDDGGKYYVRQLGSQVWWYGETSTEDPDWSNVMQGTLTGDVINARWADVPKGSVMQSGTLKIRVASRTSMTAIEKTGGFAGSTWTKAP